VLAIFILLCGGLAACGSDGSSGATPPKPAKTLTAISIDPINPSIAAGTTVQLSATGVFSDGTTEELTDSVAWASADVTIAEVSNAAGAQGLLIGKSLGLTTVTATLGQVQGSSALTVTAAKLTSITIDPADPSIAKGTTLQLAAIGNFSDGTTQDLTESATWVSIATTVAQVSDSSGSKGLTSGVTIGSATITATKDGVTGSTKIAVTSATLTSITISPVAPSIANGTTVQLAATGNFSDGTTQDLTSSATWTSAAGAIAQVSDATGSKGLVTGAGIGNTSITATQSGVPGSTPISVTAAILTALTVDPAVSAIAKGTTVQLSATGDFSDGSTEDLTNQVSWSSGDDAIAHVSNALTTKGLVTSIGVGNTSIVATLDGIHGPGTVTVTPATLLSITVAPANPSIAKGTTVQLSATGNFTDGSMEDLTSQVSWTSADDTIAQVSDVLTSEGLVTGIGVGETSVIATLDGIHGSTTVTVTAPVLLSITVAPANSSIAKGTTVRLTATGHFSDFTTQNLTSQASWTSADDTIAQVSDVLTRRGLVTGIGVGNTSIVATLDGVHGSATVIVTPPILLSITITPANPSISQGRTIKLTATGHFSDGTTQNLTQLVDWVSSKPTIAHVISSSWHANGRVFALRPGMTTITATVRSVQGSTVVKVRGCGGIGTCQ